MFKIIIKDTYFHNFVCEDSEFFSATELFFPENFYVFIFGDH